MKASVFRPARATFHARRALWMVSAAAALASAAPIRSAAQPFPSTRPDAVGMSAERLVRIDHALDAWVADGLLPGAALVVLRDGRTVVWTAAGYRDREAGDPLRPDHLFRIASQTKALVSTAVLMLQEEGRLLIGDPVSDYLPEWDHTTVAVPRPGGGYDQEPAGRRITVRDLLTHTAGIGYGGGVASDAWEAAGIQGWYFAHREEPIRETVRRMAALPMATHPGERFVYGYSTDVLGAVVEVVSGQSLDAFLRERVTGPLGMDDTDFYLDPEDAPRLATVYGRDVEGVLLRAADGAGMQAQGQYVAGPRTSLSGGAGLVSSAGDYARFLQAMLNGGVLDGVRILSPTSVALMTADHLGEAYGPEGRGFGLGFEVVEDPAVVGRPGSPGEFGWGGAYHSTYWVDPVERLVVVYLTQVIPATGLDDHGKIRALIYQAIVDSWADGPGGR